MQIAMRTGVSFLELLQWHPRDVDTFYAISAEIQQQRDDEARDARFAAMTAELQQRARG